MVQEDALLREGHSKYGNKWTEIAKMVGGRWAIILSGSMVVSMHVDNCRPVAQLMREHLNIAAFSPCTSIV